MINIFFTVAFYLLLKAVFMASLENMRGTAAQPSVTALETAQTTKHFFMMGARDLAGSNTQA